MGSGGTLTPTATTTAFSLISVTPPAQTVTVTAAGTSLPVIAVTTLPVADQGPGSAPADAGPLISSTGAAFLIALGTLAGVSTVVAAALLWWRRRTKARRSKDNEFMPEKGI